MYINESLTRCYDGYTQNPTRQPGAWNQQQKRQNTHPYDASVCCACVYAYYSGKYETVRIWSILLLLWIRVGSIVYHIIAAPRIPDVYNS